ncbi:MAG: hypothetical protein R3B13_13635 [Polyangiaceae bacterium]
MPHPNDDRLRHARRLATASVIVRAIGIVVMIGSAIGVLVALNMRRPDDRIGFSLIALAVLVLGAIVWGNGVFHAVVSRFLPTMIDIDERLDLLSRERRARKPRLDPPSVTEPVAAEVVTMTGFEGMFAGPATTPDAPPPTAQDEPMQADPSAAAAHADTGDGASEHAAAEDTPALAPSEDREENPDAAEQVAGASSHLEEDIPRVPCPLCGGGIHPQATRCVHCMRKLAGPAAAYN